MPLTINGFNSDDFTREDLITVQTVVGFINALLQASPVMNQVNLSYNATTGIISANGITNIPSVGGSQLSLRGNDATVTSSASGVGIYAGAGTATKVPAGVTILAGAPAIGGPLGNGITIGTAGGVTLTLTYSALNCSFGPPSIISGGLSLGSGADGIQAAQGSDLTFAAGPNTNSTGNMAIYLSTDAGNVFGVNEPVYGAGQFWGFSAKADAPTHGTQTITGSRGGNAALGNLLTALANNGVIVNSTTA